jgi:hypothetical protein
MENLSPTLANICNALFIGQPITMDHETRLTILQLDLGRIGMLTTSTESQNSKYENLFHGLSSIAMPTSIAD